jgi:opacity protein-like surface antigen
MSRTRVTLLVLACLAAAPSRAFADVTLFFGTTTTPANRPATGFAIGGGGRLVGAEFEFANTASDSKVLAPSLGTGMVSVLLQAPVSFFGVEPYLTGGIGGYREKLEVQGHQKTGVALSTGGGVKVSLVGPVGLRLDYRVLRLGSGALNSPAHRIYAGLNLKL